MRVEGRRERGLAPTLNPSWKGDCSAKPPMRSMSMRTASKLTWCAGVIRGPRLVRCGPRARGPDHEGEGAVDCDVRVAEAGHLLLGVVALVAGQQQHAAVGEGGQVAHHAHAADGQQHRALAQVSVRPQDRVEVLVSVERWGVWWGETRA